MGASLSGPLDQAEQDEIKEIAERIATTFGTEFAACYPVALVEKKKADKEDAVAEGVNSKLLTPAGDASYNKKVGKVRKMGDSYKNWKERFLVARNAKQNFCFEYYAKESEVDNPNAKPKGTINCKGMWPRMMGEKMKEDVAGSADDTWKYGIELKPRWGRTRRTWYLTFTEEEDAKEWLDLLQYACYYAEAPLPDDEVIANCYLSAFYATKRSEGYWGWYGADGDAVENISYFIFELVEDKILDPAFEKFEMPMGRDAAIATAKSTVLVTIRTIVKGIWNAAYEAAKAGSGALEGAIDGAMEPFITTEASIIESVGAIAEKTVGGLLKTAVEKMCPNSLKKVAAPISASVKETSIGWITYMRDTIKTAEDANSVDKKTTCEEVYDRYYGARPMAKTREACNDLEDALRSEEVFDSGSNYSARSAYWDCREINEQFFRSATATFFEKVQELKTEGADVDVEAILKQVGGQMVHDAPLVQTDIYNAVFCGAIKAHEMWTEVSQKMTDAVKPVDDTIAALGDPLKQFFNVGELGSKCLDNVLSQTLSPMLTAAADSGGLGVSALVSELGVDTY
jgi:hypothetical protein